MARCSCWWVRRRLGGLDRAGTRTRRALWLGISVVGGGGRLLRRAGSRRRAPARPEASTIAGHCADPAGPCRFVRGLRALSRRVIADAPSRSATSTACISGTRRMLGRACGARPRVAAADGRGLTFEPPAARVSSRGTSAPARLTRLREQGRARRGGGRRSSCGCWLRREAARARRGSSSLSACWSARSGRGRWWSATGLPVRQRARRQRRRCCAARARRCGFDVEAGAARVRGERVR